MYFENIYMYIFILQIFNKKFLQYIHVCVCIYIDIININSTHTHICKQKLLMTEFSFF